MATDIAHYEDLSLTSWFRRTERRLAPRRWRIGVNKLASPRFCDTNVHQMSSRERSSSYVQEKSATAGAIGCPREMWRLKEVMRANHRRIPRSHSGGVSQRAM